jgi:hypothetical protein
MYPESDYFSQLNIVSEKIDTSIILNKYTYSGEGTSSNLQQVIQVDNNNDYIVLSTEKLGPDCLTKWCYGVAPFGGKIIKYTSNLEKVWELDLTEQVNNITSNYEGNNFKIDANNNLYLNLENKEKNISFLYKISPQGKVLYKKESIKSNNVVIDESSNKVYIISKNKQRVDQTTWKIYNWTEIASFDINTGVLIKKTLFDGKQYFSHFLINDSFYVYFLNINSGDNYTNDHLVSLYKEEKLVFERKISLNIDSEINPFLPIIKENGTLIFSTHSSSDFRERKLHKLTTENNYSYSIIDEKLIKILKLNSKIVGYDDDKYLNIYDKDFKLIQKSNTTYSNCCSGFNISLIQDQIFLQWSNPDGNNSAFINENLEIINLFNFKNLFDKNFTFDKENNLVATSTYGNGIYLEPSFQWRRGLLSKYLFNGTLSLEENNLSDKNQLIKVFPNPTTDFFSINLTENTLKKIKLYSINGQLLNTYFNKKIDISMYSKGLYFLKIYTHENTVINSKILKY